jgi:hypothetical protein
VFAFNHDARYVSQVLALARAHGGKAPPGRLRRGPRGLDCAGLGAGPGRHGTPYLWGGEIPGVGLDCSGLVQGAYRAAGITLPRVAQDQYGARQHPPPGAVLQSGDLMLFGASVSSVTHVGIYAGLRHGQPVMVEGPHTSAYVRVEPVLVTPGAPPPTSAPPAPATDPHVTAEPAEDRP